MSAAFNRFQENIEQSREALEIYRFLKLNGYSADFGLRYVWVSAISSLDHYISEIIIEQSTKQFSAGLQLSAKILNEAVPFSGLLALNGATPTEAVLRFRDIISQAVRFRTFQKADDISDGLAFIWSEPHKWNKISDDLGLSNRDAKRKLNSIAYRRDKIVHNADYDESTNTVTACRHEDAIEVVRYVTNLVTVLDKLLVNL